MAIGVRFPYAYLALAVIDRARQDLLHPDDLIRESARTWFYSEQFRNFADGLSVVFADGGDLQLPAFAGLSELTLFGEYRKAEEAEAVWELLTTCGHRAIRVCRKVYIEQSSEETNGTKIDLPHTAG